MKLVVAAIDGVLARVYSATRVLSSDETPKKQVRRFAKPGILLPHIALLRPTFDFKYSSQYPDFFR